MRVEKWYLDCVTASGAGLIGYAARLGWSALAVRCSETLRWEGEAGLASNRTVFGGAPPVELPSGVHWDNQALNTRGRWSPFLPGMPRVVLHEEAAGRIEWRCCCPAARVTTEVEGRQFEGLGYAEQLVMTLPPARLPFRELHWGRFLAEGQSCVWIRWAGAVARSWCFHQGRSVPAEHRDGSELSWPDHRLLLAPGRTLRSGRVVDTVFQGTPFLRRLFPAALGEVVETKWCSRGVLTDDRGQPHHGWAIHEVAHFP